MRMIEVVTIVILILISVVSFVIGTFQFKEKGILLNNAYLYASLEERIKMNKKPHYRQSAIVFASIGVLFLLFAIELIVRSGWLVLVMIGFMIFLIGYAIASSILIARKN